jgi:hypothetical protein
MAYAMGYRSFAAPRLMTFLTLKYLVCKKKTQCKILYLRWRVFWSGNGASREAAKVL